MANGSGHRERIIRIHRNYCILTKVPLYFPDCLPSGLLVQGVSAPPLTIGNGISVRLKPHNAVKILQLSILLEDDNEQELYELQIAEHMEVVWGDMEVTLRDSKSHSNVLKVKYLFCIS